MMILLGSLITVAGAIVISLLGYRYKQWRRREHLRKAFKSELEHPLPEKDIMWVEDLDAGGVPKKELIPSTVYESNASNIGILSEEEIEKLVEYYSYVSSFKKRIAKFREFKRRKEEKIDFDSKESNKEKIKEFQESKEGWRKNLTERYDRLKGKREDAVAAIENNSLSMFR